jgi:hypothetical protein
MDVGGPVRSSPFYVSPVPDSSPCHRQPNRSVSGKWLNHFYPNDLFALGFMSFGILFIAFVASCLLRFIIASTQVYRHPHFPARRHVFAQTAHKRGGTQ